MKLSKATRIVGYEILLVSNKDPLPGGVTPTRDYWRAHGVHPVYGFEISIEHATTDQIAIDRFVRENYRLVSGKVLEEQHWRCAGCGRSGTPLEIDHIIPRSQGRLDARSNLRGLGSSKGCGGCGCHEKRHSASRFTSMTTQEIARFILESGYRE